MPLPLEFNEYAEAALDILGEEARMIPTKILKHLQNICIVYTRNQVDDAKVFEVLQELGWSRADFFPKYV